MTDRETVYVAVLLAWGPRPEIPPMSKEYSNWKISAEHMLFTSLGDEEFWGIGFDRLAQWREERVKFHCWLKNQEDKRREDSK